MLPLFMYMCMCWCVNVASVLVYVLEESIVDLSMSMCMGGGKLPMLMSMCKELGVGYCCFCSCPSICIGGSMLPLFMSRWMGWEEGSMLPLFISMCMC